MTSGSVLRRLHSRSGWVNRVVCVARTGCRSQTSALQRFWTTTSSLPNSGTVRLFAAAHLVSAERVSRIISGPISVQAPRHLWLYLQSKHELQALSKVVQFVKFLAREGTRFGRYCGEKAEGVGLDGHQVSGRRATGR